MTIEDSSGGSSEAPRPDASASKSGAAVTIDGTGILRSVDRDLAFYRQRLFTTYALILVVQLIAIVGQNTHTIAFVYPWIDVVLGISFFSLIWVVSYALRRSYVKRSNYLRATRSRIVVESTGVDPYPTPGGGEVGYGPFAWGPSALFLAVITVLSVLGVVTSLVGA